MAMTMMVWQEKVGASARSWMSSAPAFVGIPRVFVEAALKETALHPGIQVVPALQQTLASHQRVWGAFREEEIRWLLAHADLVGAVQSEPDGRAIWTAWHDRLNYTATVLRSIQAGVCRFRVLDPIACDQVDIDIAFYEREKAAAAAAVAAWNDVLRIGRVYSAEAWLTAIQRPANHTAVRNGLARLHDIERVADLRLAEIFTAIRNMSVGLSPWYGRLLQSLLTGEVWAACLEHVRLREGRVRELMYAAGVQDMVNSHERILNASLRVVSAEDRRKVQEWFGEMTIYAWFLPDGMPTLVRRCVGQDVGDCTRIGPTEIVALTEREVKRSRVRKETQRLLIGMWNAVPVVVVLFVMELVLFCVAMRADQKTFVMRLDGPRVLTEEAD
jgi:hypothetical protein